METRGLTSEPRTGTPPGEWTGWRRLLRRFAGWWLEDRPSGDGWPSGLPGRRNQARVWRGPVPVGRGLPLDLPATVARASLRQAACLEEEAGLLAPWALAPDDLRWAWPREPRQVDRCLLLDASASMAGGRWRACAALAEALLCQGPGRVATVAFRGRAGEVLSGFTRSRRRLRNVLSGVRRGGLTPLAAGLLLGLEVAREGRERRDRRDRRVQVILLTDAEPTSGFWSCDSLGDALRAAAQYRQARVPLVCCGVAANERVLAGLARASGGRFHLLADFSAESVGALSRQLRGRICPGPAEARPETAGRDAREG